MDSLFGWLNEFIDSLINNLSIGTALISCGLITIESIFPVLPLFAFITINFLVFGKVLGFLFSYIFTIIGCSLSFFIFRKIKNGFTKRRKKQASKVMKRINRVKLSSLAVIMANPFTPAFAVNIAAALSKMDFKKFFLSLLIGKFFLVYFWGFVGTSLVNSLQSPIELFKIAFMMVIAYLIGKIINRYFDLD